MNKVIKTIRLIKSDKIQRKVFPTYATRKELLAEGCAVEEIREAVKSGLVRFGQTLNDYYFVENLQD